MGFFFSNAQGQLTPQSLVESCRISNSSEIFWLSSIHARMKNEDARVIKNLYVVFSDAQGQLTPKSAVEFCRNIELIQAFIVVLVTCKNEEDQIKNE